MLINLLDEAPHFAHSIRFLEAIVMFYSYLNSRIVLLCIWRCLGIFRSGEIEDTSLLTDRLRGCILFLYIDVTKSDLVSF